MARNFVGSDEIRSAFSDAMSEMYRTEAPLYGDLIDIVVSVDDKMQGIALVTGHSCRSQTKRLGGFRPAHPVEFLAARIGAGASR